MLPFTFSNELIPKQPSVTHTNELYITSFITSSPSTNIKLVTRSAIANNTSTTNDANPTIFFSFISFFSATANHFLNKTIGIASSTKQISSPNEFWPHY